MKDNKSKSKQEANTQTKEERKGPATNLMIIPDKDDVVHMYAAC